MKGMKLLKFYDTLEYLRGHTNCIAKPSNNNKPYALNLRFDPEFECFGWTDNEGNFIKNIHEPKGYKRVIVSSKLMDTDSEIINLT